MKERRFWRAAAPVALACIVALIIPRPAAITPAGWRLLGIFVGAITGLLTQPIPGGAVVLIAVTLSAVFGGLTPQDALSGYGDPTCWLVMTAFFIARSLINTGLARRIALVFVRIAGRTPVGVCYALSASDMLLATIIPSNGARSGGVTLPIVRSVCEVYESRPGKSAGILGSFLMTAVYQNICITAAMFLTGQAGNALAARIAGDTFHYPVTWTSWFVAGIVPGICSLAIVPWVVFWVNPPEVRRTPEATAFAARELKAMGRMKRGERIVLAVFAAVCTGWITSPLHRLDVTVIALLGVAGLVVTGALTWEDVKNERAAWDIFIWYGGLLMLARALSQAGLTGGFARAVSAQFGGLGWPALFAVALLIYFYAHYGFASISAHLLAMFTPFAGVLIAKGAPVGCVIFAFATFANLSAGLTNYGTTPAPMFFAQDYVSLRRWLQTGAVVSVANLAVWCSVGFLWWKLIGLW